MQEQPSPQGGDSLCADRNIQEPARRLSSDSVSGQPAMQEQPSSQRPNSFSDYLVFRPSGDSVSAEHVKDDLVERQIYPLYAALARICNKNTETLNQPSVCDERDPKTTTATQISGAAEEERAEHDEKMAEEETQPIEYDSATEDQICKDFAEAFQCMTPPLCLLNLPFPEHLKQPQSTSPAPALDLAETDILRNPQEPVD